MSKEKKTNSFSMEYFLVESLNIQQHPVKVANKKIQYTIDPSGVLLPNNKYQLKLNVSIKESGGSFTIDLTGIALFKFDDMEDPHLKSYFYLNAPAIVFPYIRSYVSGVTALSGINTVTLPVTNLSHLKEKLEENTVKPNLPEKDASATKSKKTKKSVN